VFVTDSWKLGRVVLNYGVRWERYHTFYPTQKKAAGPFSPATTYSSQDLLTWKDVTARFINTRVQRSRPGTLPLTAVLPARRQKWTPGPLMNQDSLRVPRTVFAAYRSAESRKREAV